NAAFGTVTEIGVHSLTCDLSEIFPGARRLGQDHPGISFVTACSKHGDDLPILLEAATYL
ncbi:hypothetical protein IC580_11915, partial [Cupriavidus sp. ISTL7]